MDPWDFLTSVGKEASFCSMAHDPRQPRYLHESVITRQMKQHGDVCFLINPPCFLEPHSEHMIYQELVICVIFIYISTFAKKKNNAL